MVIIKRERLSYTSLPVGKYVQHKNIAHTVIVHNQPKEIASVAKSLRIFPNI